MSRKDLLNGFTDNFSKGTTWLVATGHTCNGLDGMDSTSSVPKYVLHYLLDMVKCFSLETIFDQ